MSGSTGTGIDLGGGDRLRPWRASDAPSVLSLFTDPDVCRWDYLLPMRSADQAREWLASRAAGWADGSRASWAISDAADDVVGSVAISHLDLAASPFPPLLGTISYQLLPSGRGRGLATRAAIAASDWLHEARGMHRVELHHDVANTASCAVAARAGFLLEGTRRAAQRIRDGWVDEHLHARVLPSGRAGGGGPVDGQR